MILWTKLGALRDEEKESIEKPSLKPIRWEERRNGGW